MIEIFKILNRQNLIEKTRIEIEESPQNIIGASISKEHRIVYFETEQPETFYIDFVPYSGTVDCVFIVPAGHILYLPNTTTNIHCIYIPHKYLSNLEKYWIFKLKYKKQKEICYNSEKIKDKKSDLSRILNQVLSSANPAEQNTPSLQYIQQAEALIDSIQQANITHQLSINDLTEAINATRKTVLRVCNIVFDETPTNIIRYHLFLSIIFQTIKCHIQPLSDIAINLGFRDLSTFNRYVKAISGYTPKELRENYNHIKL